MRALLPALAGLLLFTGIAQAKDVKIAYVDMQRALLEVEDGKQAKARLEKLKSERQGKLDASQEELRAMQKNFEAQKAFMKPEVMQEKQKEFAQKLQALQMTYATLQKELVAEEAKETQKIFKRMAKIVADVGEKEGYTVILEKTESSILWAPKHLEITNDLIRRYNAGEGK